MATVLEELGGETHTLFIARRKGNFVLYRILQAYVMLDIKVTGLTLRDVSITYTTTVGNDEA